MDGKRLILEQTFTNAYDIKNFTIFIKEFFNCCIIVNKDYKDHWNWSEFSYYINGYTYVGNYYDKAKSKIAILAVELKKNRSVERARSMQRNFISKLISNANYDAAIVAFYSKDEPKWRLSLVRLDYEFAKGRAKAKLTPAKRYSYLVGEKEPCHTAMERLLPIFRDDKFNPTLDSIDEAFNVEKVTEEFFNKYREKYYKLKEHLDKNKDFNEEVKKHNFTSEQFAKKLMGQLAFLYFLQKKGWLGIKVLPHVINEKEFKNSYYSYNKAARTIVPKVYKQIAEDKYKLDYNELQCLNDEEANILAACFKAELWGSGTKTFVRDLFNNCSKLQQKEKKNFFDDYLAPLFYEALNHKRGESNYYKRFNCKIPFLNGGLFEPLENYDWKNSKFKIPDDLFSNKHLKGEEEADGILDIFDRYNFTMNEDEPLEREVAVDPEMLGKIFENLLDVKDRKSKGAFYTPREIVHYMCQESLINYLVNETGISYEDIKAFITYGEIMKDEDTGKASKLGTDEMQIPTSIYNNLKLIDDRLANVRVADPAVGSGAFLMGMISEIIKARNNITTYIAGRFGINSSMSDSEKKMLKEQRARIYDMRNPYKLKRDTIKNSIYAVDIEASAVDIAKLRLWLSLVVEEELEPTFDEQVLGITDQKDPQPLPNLDYNIMCGNSLIDEFEGVKLFDNSVLERKEQPYEATSTAWQVSLFNDNVDTLLQELFKLQDKYFNEDDSERKTEVKKNIDKRIDDIIRAKLLRDGNAVGLEKYERSINEKTKPYFLWKLEFAKVFKEKDGFDIVIGNPPYVGHKGGLKEQFEQIKKTDLGKRFNNERMDIFYYFYHKGLDLLKNFGNISYITTNYFVTADSAIKLRKDFKQRATILKIINFNEFRIFRSAQGQHNAICILSKSKLEVDCKFTITSRKGYDSVEVLKAILNGSDKDTNYFQVPQDRIYNENNYDITLSNDFTGADAVLNAITDKMQQCKYNLCDICNISQGIVTGLDKISDKHLKNKNTNFHKDEGCFVLSEDEFRKNFSKDNQYIKPWFKNSDIDKYFCKHTPSKYLLYLNTDYSLGENDEVDKHIKRFEPVIKLRNYDSGELRKAKRIGKWWALSSSRREFDFSKPKIVSPQRSLKNKFGYNTGKWYASADVYFITDKNNDENNLKYLLGILNSKLIYLWLYKRGKRKGESLELYLTPLSNIPIIKDTEYKYFIIELVSQILSIKNNSNENDILNKLEDKLNILVYKAYGLNEREAMEVKSFYDCKEL